MSEQANTYWKTHRVLVTGGNGFLGSHLLPRLRALGAEAYAPRSAAYDLRRESSVVAMLEEYQPTVVIHAAAAVGGIGINQRRPAEFFYDNLRMGIHLIHESCEAGVSKLVVVGTVCSYPKFTNVPFNESDLWEGYPEETNAPYGISKKALLVQCLAYRQQYDFNSIYLIPTNLYGERDNFNPDSSHVIPALIRKCLIAKARGDAELVVWGTGRATREFLYAGDAAEAILAAAEQYDGEEPINIGSGQEISIMNLAEMIAHLTGFHGRIVWDDSKPDGQPRRCLDTRKAKEYFGFEARTPFREGLEKTIRWAIATGAWQAEAVTA